MRRLIHFVRLMVLSLDLGPKCRIGPRPNTHKAWPRRLGVCWHSTPWRSTRKPKCPIDWEPKAIAQRAQWHWAVLGGWWDCGRSVAQWLGVALDGWWDQDCPSHVGHPYSWLLLRGTTMNREWKGEERLATLFPHTLRQLIFYISLESLIEGRSTWNNILDHGVKAWF